MRPSETMPLDIQNSRCGEIYVSNKADKWTFFCSYCQKGTSDIGVFICHIRLDHLSSMLDSETQKDNVASEEELQFPDTDCEAFDRASDHALDPNLIKEETISQFSYESESSPVPNKISKTVDISDRSETENKDSAKNSISTDYPTIDISEEYFTITSKDPPDLTEEDTPSVQENREIVRVLYNKNENDFNNTNDEPIPNDDIEHNYNVDTCSVYSIEDDEDDLLIEDDREFENIDDNKASSSKSKNAILHVCDFCYMNFKLRSALDSHLKKIHNQKLSEMPLKCKECRKVFRSLPGYKNHLNKHDERSQRQCPVCKVTHNKNYFITHVMGHENDTCFPCMVCGKIFPTHAERMKHWETHAKDKPFVCNLCYRRFRQKHFLLHHLKSHGHYSCYFCPDKFVTSKTPRPPYVCPKCEKLPDIGYKITHHKQFAHKSFVDESEEE